MIGLWTTIKGYLTAILAGFIALLGAFAFYQKHRADGKEEEVDELERQLEANGYNYEIKEFEAINKERKDHAETKLDDIDIRIDDGSHSL